MDIQKLKWVHLHAIHIHIALVVSLVVGAFAMFPLRKPVHVILNVMHVLPDELTLAFALVHEIVGG